MSEKKRRQKYTAFFINLTQLEFEIQHSKFSDQVSVRMFIQRFGEDVSQLFSGRNVVQ